MFGTTYNLTKLLGVTENLESLLGYCFVDNLKACQLYNNESIKEVVDNGKNKIFTQEECLKLRESINTACKEMGRESYDIIDLLDPTQLPPLESLKYNHNLNNILNSEYKHKTEEELQDQIDKEEAENEPQETQMMQEERPYEERKEDSEDEIEPEMQKGPREILEENIEQFINEIERNNKTTPLYVVFLKEGLKNYAKFKIDMPMVYESNTNLGLEYIKNSGLLKSPSKGLLDLAKKHGLKDATKSVSNISSKIALIKKIVGQNLEKNDPIKIDKTEATTLLKFAGEIWHSVNSIYDLNGQHQNNIGKLQKILSFAKTIKANLISKKENETKENYKAKIFESAFKIFTTFLKGEKEQLKASETDGLAQVIQKTIEPNEIAEVIKSYKPMDKNNETWKSSQKEIIISCYCQSQEDTSGKLEELFGEHCN